MNEIYWITRLDGIITASCVFLTLSGVAIIALALLVFIDGDDEFVMCAETRKKLWRHSITICIITSLICGFVPSSKTAMAIWGVGAVIDYVQENETLKELPDKCVEALEAWSDSFLEGEE